ncbi:hypothetical protein M514_20232 [Trichuris suis]|nr:hypothetical protein M514_20232 [Trichuris suis]
MGRSVPDLAPDVICTEDISLKKRWRYSEFLANQFWKRWIKEYLPTLMGRRKWFTQQRNLRNDDVVIVIEPDMPRGKWSLGRVIHVFPGDDGIVRSALVRANGTTVHRPATKLCLLESADNDVDSPSVHRAGDVAN